MYDGVLNIYKEQGFTSFDVVAKLRGILKQKKIGHTGTLDPLAEGVLLVCLGKATKLSEMITSKNKEYEAVMQLGITTDTEDIMGAVKSTREVTANDTEVSLCINSFIGDYNQIPPMYSAIKINGKKLYEYARAGIEIERTSRRVTINNIEIINISLPYVTFKVNCSKGTYIRSLCRDIGEKLGCGAIMTKLVRKEVNGYSSEDGLKLSDIEKLVKAEDLDRYIYPMDTLLSEYPIAAVKAEAEKYIVNGNKLTLDEVEFTNCTENEIINTDSLIRMYLNNNFLALYKYDNDERILRPYKMFL